MNIINACRPGLLCPQNMVPFHYLIYTIYSIILFAGTSVSGQDDWSAGDREEEVAEMKQSSSTGAHGETSSNNERSKSQTAAFADSQIALPFEVVPHDAEDHQLYSLMRQESLRLKPQMQMQKMLGAVFNPKQLIDTYLSFRQSLGNDVRKSHEEWVQLQATNDHPLLKVAGLAFGVTSGPGTSAYMEQQWDQLHLGQDSPDAIIARAMMDYALAWACHREDLEKAYNIVYAFYKEMEGGDSSNFFLAPCYTVTIGRWTYDANHHRLSYQEIEEVKKYAYKTLTQLRSLKDEWAIIDTFGMKLNATLLLLRVKKYYTNNSLSVDKLERDIENLLEELDCSLSHPKITTYDEAGFYSVLKLNFENVNREEFCRCAKESAELFRKNGRIRRAQEEAEHSGDIELVRELSIEAQDIPE